MEQAEDSELARRIARGDRDAFRDFVESHKKLIYALAYRMAGNHVDAEDISQDVFLKIFRSAAAYDGSARLSTWVYRITANSAIDHMRRKRQTPARFREIPIDDIARGAAQDGVVSGRNPAQEAEARLLRREIERALAAVSERERAAFILRHYHDLDLKEIAEAMDISLGAVKSYLFRAVRKLQKELGPAAARRPAEAFHD